MRTDTYGPYWVGCLSGMVFLLALLVGTSCARTIQGQVLDAETGKPIAGAVVLGVWTKPRGFGEHYTELVGVREAETDADGRFVLTSLGGGSSSRKVLPLTNSATSDGAAPFSSHRSNDERIKACPPKSASPPSFRGRATKSTCDLLIWRLRLLSLGAVG